MRPGASKTYCLDAYLIYSKRGVPAARVAIKQGAITKGTEPHPYIEIVNMASGMDRGSVLFTRSRNKAAMLQLIPSSGLQRTSLILDNHVMVSSCDICHSKGIH